MQREPIPAMLARLAIAGFIWALLACFFVIGAPLWLWAPGGPQK